MKAHVPFFTHASFPNPTNTQEAINENQQLPQTSPHREPALPGRTRSFIKEATLSLLSRLSLSSVNMEIPHQSNSREFANKISSVFPGISFDFLQSLSRIFRHDTEAAVNHIMDEEELGRPYQGSEEKSTISLKRKRDEDTLATGSDAGVAIKTKQRDTRPKFVPRSSFEMLSLCKLLHQEYPCVPNKAIGKLLKDNDFCLRTTYLALDSFISVWHALPKKPWEMISDPDALQRPYLNPKNQKAMKAAIRAAKDGFKKSVLEELAICWKLRAVRDEKRRYIPPADVPRETVQGTDDEDLMECQCCFLEYSLHHMVHCEGEAIHFFCINCARRNAETLIGLSKYELSCMSMDKCSGGFSKAERDKFLDDKLNKALDQIESAAMLLLANLEGLVHCPFCDYAAQCPPVEEDREFRCANPACKSVSCRLCEKVAHTPKTCAEFARENGHSARREIEEAMSAAMIRKCNRCKTPFVKEAGCNKMTCPRPECRNVQCYICSKTCDYRHFNDPIRGGRAGNCPLYDSVEVRHENEVKVAEAEARKAVVEKQPDVDPSLLNFQMSEGVFQDDERRKLSDQRRQPNNHPGAVFVGIDLVAEHPRVGPPLYVQGRPPALPGQEMYRPPWLEPVQGQGIPPELPGLPQPPAPYAQHVVPAVQVAERAVLERVQGQAVPLNPPGLPLPPAIPQYAQHVVPAVKAAERAADMVIRPGVVPFPGHNALGPINPAMARVFPVDIDLLPFANFAHKFDPHVDQNINIHHPLVGGRRPGDLVGLEQWARDRTTRLRIHRDERAAWLAGLRNNHGPHVNQ